MWEIEDIPDQATLYMRLNKVWMENGEPIPGFFKIRKGEIGMSSDWEKYSTPEETRNRAKKEPDNNAVIAMEVGAIRKIPGQAVDHAPIEENQAHTHIIGVTTAARAQFMNIYRIVLPLPGTLDQLI